jgi:hypothetical protein
MDEILSRLIEDLVGRVRGPLSFRLILQPAIATFFAVRAGLQDAREGHPSYFWALANDAAHRRQLLKDGWKSIAKVFTIALVLDGVYQYMVLRWLYPGEACSWPACLLLSRICWFAVRSPLLRAQVVDPRSQGQCHDNRLRAGEITQA